jgi:hypothetical protein
MSPAPFLTLRDEHNARSAAAMSGYAGGWPPPGAAPDGLFGWWPRPPSRRLAGLGSGSVLARF